MKKNLSAVINFRFEKILLRFLPFINSELQLNLFSLKVMQPFISNSNLDSTKSKSKLRTMFLSVLESSSKTLIALIYSHSCSKVSELISQRCAAEELKIIMTHF